MKTLNLVAIVFLSCLVWALQSDFAGSLRTLQLSSLGAKGDGVTDDSSVFEIAISKPPPILALPCSEKRGRHMS
jgi:hypothetical protein